MQVAGNCDFCHNVLAATISLKSLKCQIKGTMKYYDQFSGTFSVYEKSRTRMPIDDRCFVEFHLSIFYTKISFTKEYSLLRLKY